jgi:hypothetical protein
MPPSADTLPWGWGRDDVASITTDVESRTELSSTLPNRHAGVLEVEVPAAPACLDGDGLGQAPVLLLQLVKRFAAQMRNGPGATIQTGQIPA